MSKIQRYREPSAIAPQEQMQQLVPSQDALVHVWRQLPTELQTDEHWAELYKMADAGQWGKIQEIAQEARSLTITDSRQYHHTDNRRYTYTDNRRYSSTKHSHTHMHASGFWIATLIAVVASAFALSVPGRIQTLMESQPNVTQEQP